MKYLIQFRIPGILFFLFFSSHFMMIHGIADHFQNRPPENFGQVSDDYSQRLDSDIFEQINLESNPVEGAVFLNTRINNDTSRMIVPFTQGVAVTFVYEGSTMKDSEFGWMPASEGPDGHKNIIYRKLSDDLTQNGVLDHMEMDRNQDGQLSARDNTMRVGPFSQGTELVFYLDTSRNPCKGRCGGLFFTKREWNEPHARCDTGIRRTLSFPEPAGPGKPDCTHYEAGCDNEINRNGWLDHTALDRLKNTFGLRFGESNPGLPDRPNTYCIDEKKGSPATHAVIGMPETSPFDSILGFEDSLMNDPGKLNDYDYNDFIILVEQKYGGALKLKPGSALIPDVNVDHAFFTGAVIQVFDNLTACEDSEQAEITYFLSADGGVNWVEINTWDRSEELNPVKGPMKAGDGGVYPSENIHYRRKIRSVDFTDLGLTGRELTWKAELVSRDGKCIPGVSRVVLTGFYASHGFLSRSSPLIKANLIYTGFYETPKTNWVRQTSRGHLLAARLYDPENPNRTITRDQVVWDAGAVLNHTRPDNRKILFPKITVKQVRDEYLKDKEGNPIYGDGVQTAFSGILANGCVMADTLRVYDDHEIFTNQHVNELKGSYSGKGRVDHYKGNWQVTFQKPPAKNVPIRAGYSHYLTSNPMHSFEPANVDQHMLALSKKFIYPKGYIHDLNQDNRVDQRDAEWAVQWIRGYESPEKRREKEWKLGPIRHSTPTMLVPPGLPSWYTGTSVTRAERQSLDHFRKSNQNRSAVLFIGTKDGLLHAFDAGKFQPGNNPATTAVDEKRGYFQWMADDIPCSDSGPGCKPDYGSGKELWAFIPPNLLSRLKYNVIHGEDRAGLDTSPVLADVRIQSIWRTVLLMTEGNSGDFLFCLDVTDPVKPSFLWEYGSWDLLRKNTSPALPAVGRIYDPQTGNEKWITFILSGEVKNAFPVVYMIDVSDGRLYGSIRLDHGVDLNGDGFLDPPEKEYGRGGVLVSCPVILDTDHNGYIDRIYVASSKGVIYKINIPDDDGNSSHGMTHCILNGEFRDSNQNELPQDQRWQPIHAPPTVIFEYPDSGPGKSNPRIRIFFGTGSDDTYDENISTGYFFSYIDRSTKGECDPDKQTLDWYIELDQGQGLFTPAFVAAGTIYFGTSSCKNGSSFPRRDKDQPADGTIRAVTSSGQIKYRNHIEALVAPILVEDQHLYIRTMSGLKSFGKGVYNNEIKKIGISRMKTLLWRELSGQI